MTIEPNIAIRARNVTLTLGTNEAPTEILMGIDLDIERGASVAILGPSGSGKSSLMAILSGLEQASGGTLLLDEIGEMPLEMQPKLLRVLQERQLRPVGGNTVVPVDCRIVAATNRDLESEVEEQRFREDLYYRLAEIVVKIPSLAERPGDAVLLARHFVNRFGKELNTKVQSLSADALAAIDAYGWPGNVRELENRIKRSVIMADGKSVSAEDLDLPGNSSAADEVELALNLRAARETADRRAIRQALSRTDNNISGAAKLLGISRPTLYDLIKQYQLSA